MGETTENIMWEDKYKSLLDEHNAYRQRAMDNEKRLVAEYEERLNEYRELHTRQMLQKDRVIEEQVSIIQDLEKRGKRLSKKIDTLREALKAVL